jgi:hypothetical protein
MRQPPDRQRETPATTTGGSRKNSSTTTEPVTSVDEGIPTVADIGSPIVELIAELRPDLPLSVASSLVVERLDEFADTLLDEAWARQRQRLYPEAVRSAHSRHAGRGYERRRAAECFDVPAKPGDHKGGPVPWLRVV